MLRGLINNRYGSTRLDDHVVMTVRQGETDSATEAFMAHSVR